MEKKGTSKRYPPELKERAVRMVKDHRRQDPGDKAVISRVARQLGVGDESLRAWVKQFEINSGARAGLTTDEQAELTELRKEVRELRRSNDILQAAATFMSNPRLCAAVRGHEEVPSFGQLRYPLLAR